MTIVAVLRYLIERGYLTFRFPTMMDAASIHDFTPLENDLAFTYRIVATGGACEVFREHADGSATLYFVAQRGSGMHALETQKIA